MREIERYIACAKINLGLEILFKRPDGYHELNTIFYRVLEPHDSITVTNANLFRLTCSQDSLPTDSRNLMMRAAQLFADRSGAPLPPLHIHLEKHIPMGAGLGGGSSDAAIMLEILRDRASTSLTAQDLEKLAAEIGADVPFFLSGHRAAIANGIGERLTPIELEIRYPLLIVKDPETSVPTPLAYAGITLTEQRHRTDFSGLLNRSLTTDIMTAHLRNDFERSVIARYPRIGRIKDLLSRSGAAFSLMSGSGSAVFAFFLELEVAEQAKATCESSGLLAYLS